jgi:hypothetical protein
MSAIRIALLLLVSLSVVATAFELATERHWNGLVQLIPWVGIAVLVLATGVLAIGGARSVVVARVLAVLVLAASVYGVVQHVVVNYEFGALDAVYGQGWESLPVPQRWWYALTKTVGPSPPLAPGVLGQAALLLLLATMIPARPAGRTQPSDR